MTTAPSIARAGWTEINNLRAAIVDMGDSFSVERAAKKMVDLIADGFESVRLVRMFVIAEIATLPVEVQTVARGIDPSKTLDAKTLVLSLLATRGSEPEWNSRSTSRGHRAIPLIDRAFVEDAPMIAALLSALDVPLNDLASGAAVATQKMAGWRNGRFYVEDARTAKNDRGDKIIANQEFVERYGIHTVFGMGGAYGTGPLVVCLMFTDTHVPIETVELFPSLISSFKMATNESMLANRIYGG